MKMTKMLQKLMGMMAVGTALMMTGSVANAADGGSQPTTTVEGPCPNKNCKTVCEPCNEPYGWLSQTSYITTDPVCVNCDAKCPSHLYRVEVKRYDCIRPTIQGGTYIDQCHTQNPVGGLYGDC